MPPDFKIPDIIDNHVIKAIFQEKAIALNLTNILLPENLSLVAEESSVLNHVQNSQGKICNPDLRIGDKNLSVWTEFQKNHFLNTENRIDVYSSGQFFTDVEVGSDYSRLKKSVVIWISNNSLNKSEEKNYYRVENQGGNIVHVYIELDRFRKYIKGSKNLPELSERDHVIFTLSFPNTYERLIPVHQRPAFVKTILTLYKNYCTAYIMAKRKIEIHPNSNICGQIEKKLEQRLIYKSAIRYLEGTTLPSKKHFQTTYEDFLDVQTINHLFETYTAPDCPDVKPAKRSRLQNDTDDETENTKKSDNEVVKDVERNNVESNNEEEVDKEFKNRFEENFLALKQCDEFNSIERAQELMKIGSTDDQIMCCTYLNKSELISLKKLIDRRKTTKVKIIKNTKVKIETKECYVLIPLLKENSEKVHSHENKANITASTCNLKKVKECAKRLPLKTLNVNVKTNYGKI